MAADKEGGGRGERVALSEWSSSFCLAWPHQPHTGGGPFGAPREDSPIFSSLSAHVR